MFYEKINKYWIGYIYGYALFGLFFSLGVIVGHNSTELFEIFSVWVMLICLAIVLPITIIREKEREKERIKKKELEVKE